MLISDSPWAPTGFGTNTKSIAAIFNKAGHTIGYGGCQNQKHEPEWKTPWPLGQTEEEATFELLPIMHPGQEKFGEKSFDTWCNVFQPKLIFTHLDIQMFEHVTQRKRPTGANIPLVDNDGNWIKPKERKVLLDNLFKQVMKGPDWVIGSIVPVDGQPSMPKWKDVLNRIDYPVAMSRYGMEVIKADFPTLGDEWFKRLTYIPHGVDTNLFKPKLGIKPNDAFVVGCVARNQHRKNIPRLMRGYKHFVEENKLKPKDTKLLLHMYWKDGMGWDIEEMAKYFGLEDYMIPPTMGNLDAEESPSEAEMVDLYNLMDVFVLPTAGEGFGIPTIEAMACGKPVAVTNYTTGYEIVGMKDPDDMTEKIPLFAEGQTAHNGRDHLIADDWSDRGCVLPYKDMWWDTPKRAAPQRAIVSEVAIAEVLNTYYKDPIMKLEHGAGARKYAQKHYDWSVVGAKWLNWVEMVAKEEKK